MPYGTSCIERSWCNPYHLTFLSSPRPDSRHVPTSEPSGSLGLKCQLNSIYSNVLPAYHYHSSLPSLAGPRWVSPGAPLVEHLLVQSQGFCNPCSRPRGVEMAFPLASYLQVWAGVKNAP